MKALILFCLSLILTLVSGIGKNKKLFILIYHRVLDEPDYMRVGEVDKESFTWQMALLEKYFNVLSLSDALEKMQSDKLPARAVCITFDDGYADNYLNALPILKQFNLKATFFIANGYLNGGIMWNDKVIEAVRLMTSQQLDLNEFKLGVFDIKDEKDKLLAAQQIILKIKHLEANKRQKIADNIASRVNNMPTELMLADNQLVQLYQSGMEIGGHTVTHPIISNLKDDALEKELHDNKTFLEKLLKTKLKFFAYPNGKPNIDYKMNQIELVKKMQYQAAVSTEWGVSNKMSDYFQLQRFTPWDKDSIRFMLRIVLNYFYRK